MNDQFNKDLIRHGTDRGVPTDELPKPDPIMTISSGFNSSRRLRTLATFPKGLDA